MVAFSRDGPHRHHYIWMSVSAPDLQITSYPEAPHHYLTSFHSYKMHLSHIIPFTVSGLASLTLADPDLKPWQISHLSTFSPPNREGSSPWSLINITIADPNGLIVNPAICVTKWTFEEPPYDKVNACSDIPGGQWSFAMLEADSTNPSPTTDFRVRFELKKGDEVFEGTEGFKVGDNMSGLCSAGGVCSFGLKEENTPFPVIQRRVE